MKDIAIEPAHQKHSLKLVLIFNTVPPGIAYGSAEKTRLAS